MGVNEPEKERYMKMDLSSKDKCDGIGKGNAFGDNNGSVGTTVSVETPADDIFAIDIEKRMNAKQIKLETKNETSKNLQNVTKTLPFFVQLGYLGND